METAQRPFVSIVMPVRNEAPYIARNLEAVLSQDYPPDRFEVLVADGMSTDGTRGIVEALAAREPRLRLVENPGRIVSSGLNRAIAVARGEVIVRIDGHCEYPADYLARVVALRAETGAANVGGVLVPIGTSYVQRCICAALTSRIGIGGSALRAQEESAPPREVDAVHGGCWRLETLREAGPFSEEMVRNQDDEMSFRLRRSGGRILQAPSIRVRYVVRDRWGKLFRQFAQYGYWKVRVVRRYPRQSSLRHLMPAALVAFLAVGLLAAIFSPLAARAFGALVSLYFLGIALAALAASRRGSLALWPGVTFALLLVQIGYGVGFLAGLAAMLLPRGADRLFSGLSR
jgi:glycosyltransferase involved in cell wall biosynthesis